MARNECTGNPFSDPQWCQQAYYFGMNSYELGFNEQMETLPPSFYDHTLNPYVRNITPQATAPITATINNDGTISVGHNEIPVTATNANSDMQFSLTDLIKNNPLPTLGVTLFLGWLFFKGK